MNTSSLKRTPLFELQKNAGASFREYGGWALADHYGDPAAEERSVRQSAGFIDVSCRAKIRVEGSDRAPFLHGMVSNDVKKLKEGEGLYAAMLNAQGQMLADLHLFCFENHLLIDATASLTQKIISTLGKYIIMEDVSLKDVTEGFAFLGLEGPASIKFLSHLIKEALSMPAYSHQRIKLGNFEAEIFRLSFTGSEGFYFLIESRFAGEFWDFILKEGGPFGIKPFGARALNALRIEAGIPWYGLDMGEKNLLPETGLNHAISLDKGCYIGQEVIARLSSFAKVNKKLVGLEIASDRAPASGAKITVQGKEAGYLTSSAFSSTLKKTIGLGYLAKDLCQPGTEVSLEADGKIQARVATLPFTSCRKT